MQYSVASNAAGGGARRSHCLAWTTAHLRSDPDLPSRGVPEVLVFKIDLESVVYACPLDLHKYVGSSQISLLPQ